MRMCTDRHRTVPGISRGGLYFQTAVRNIGSVRGGGGHTNTRLRVLQTLPPDLGAGVVPKLQRSRNSTGKAYHSALAKHKMGQNGYSKLGQVLQKVSDVSRQ
jgi:hypothetical protein